MTKFTNDFSKEVWESTYRFGNEETVDDTFRRLATAVAQNEKDPMFWEEKFFKLLSDFKFVPGGRIISNAGTNISGTSLINCFVSNFTGEHQDSMEGILSALRNQALILKAEGGYGTSFNVLRPKGAYVEGIANETPGAVKMMELWDKQSEIITMGSGSVSDKLTAKKKIRKGAQMGELDVWHPEIEEFIIAKQTPGRLSKFNLSVGITDDFMYAVKNHLPWSLVFPDYENHKLDYNKYWNGDLKKWLSRGFPVKTYKTYTDANILWDLITKSTYNRNEPGILFVDVINKMNNLQYCEHIFTSNPCQPEWATVLTPEGIRTFGDIQIGSTIWSRDGWTKVINKSNSGIKDVYRYRTTRGVFYGTENHKILDNGTKIEVKDAKNIDALQFNLKQNVKLNVQDVMDGLVIGDGSVHKASNNLVLLHIGKNDNDYFESEINPLIVKHRKALKETAYEIISTINFTELPSLPTRKIPERFFKGSKEKVCGFLKGLYSANGSIVGQRVTLKTSSSELRDQVQIMLSSVGINSYFTTNKKKKVLFKNGEYECKESYDINISKDRIKFQKHIGFLQNYKNTKLEKAINDTEHSKGKEINPIKSVELVSIESVFNVTVDNKSHTYWTGGCDVSNCGEQPLPNAGVCLLSNINLTQYIKEGDWNLDALSEDIPTMIRFMDNINEIANVPLPEQKESLKDKRRIGLGVLGYASALLLLEMKYGESNTLTSTEALMSHIANTAYVASSMLAKEKGSFLLYNREEYLKSEYLKVLKPETIESIRQHGIRNSHLLSIAPTGNTSAFANNVAGGLEPLFSTDYYRTYIIPSVPEGMKLPTKIDWISKSAETNGWIWIEEGNDNLLTLSWKNETYKYDKNRGLTKVVHIEDYGYKLLNNPTHPCVITSNELSIDEHLNTMAIFAKYMDAAVSKTINIPANFPYEQFKDVYMKVYDTGYIKGCTTYRDGTMMNVLSTSIQSASAHNEAVKRPKKMPCDIHHLTVGGHRWIVLIGLIEPDKPYEVFAFKNKNVNLSTSITKGFLTKVKSGYYNLELDYLTLENVTDLFTQDEEEALTRILSMALRHNVDIKHIVEQLNKSEGTIVSFSKAISRTLKKYVKDEVLKEVCPECGAPLLRVEGCTECSECDYSVC